MTQFRYGLCRWFCTGPHGGGGWANWQTQADDFADGTASPRASSAFRTPYCVFYQAGSRFFLNRTAAFTFSRGVGISGAIGIDLSAQTGYDHGAALSYRVTGRNGRLICGPRTARTTGCAPSPRWTSSSSRHTADQQRR